jgi:hypothetical protein
MEQSTYVNDNSTTDSTEALREYLASVNDTDNPVLEEVARGSISLAEALAELGSLKVREDRWKAVYRGRVILKRAYPDYPIDNYSNSYVEKMTAVMPKLFAEARFGRSGHPERHLSRLELWLDGASVQELATAEEQSATTTAHWPTSYFPIILRQKLSFYDIARAADRLWDVEELLDSK